MYVCTYIWYVGMKLPLQSKRVKVNWNLWNGRLLLEIYIPVFIVSWSKYIQKWNIYHRSKIWQFIFFMYTILRNILVDLVLHPVRNSCFERIDVYTHTLTKLYGNKYSILILFGFLIRQIPTFRNEMKFMFLDILFTGY